MRWCSLKQAIVVSVVLLSALTTGVSAQPLLIESIRPLPAATPAMLIEQFRDWQIACPNPKASTENQGSCIMEPTQSAYKGGAGLRRLFGRMISVPGKTNAVLVFVINTKLGLLLSKGITLQIDNRRPQKLAFRSCHVGGCIIPFQLSKQLKSALRRGRILKLSLTDSEGNKERVAISLMGFTKSLKALTVSERSLN